MLWTHASEAGDGWGADPGTGLRWPAGGSLRRTFRYASVALLGRLPLYPGCAPLGADRIQSPSSAACPCIRAAPLGEDRIQSPSSGLPCTPAAHSPGGGSAPVPLALLGRLPLYPGCAPPGRGDRHRSHSPSSAACPCTPAARPLGGGVGTGLTRPPRWPSSCIPAARPLGLSTTVRRGSHARPYYIEVGERCFIMERGGRHDAP